MRPSVPAIAHTAGNLRAIHTPVKLLVCYDMLAVILTLGSAHGVKLLTDRFEASKQTLSYCLAVLRRCARAVSITAAVWPSSPSKRTQR